MDLVLIGLILSAVAPTVWNKAILELKFIRYINHAGTGENGHCCDGRGLFCFSKCDHRFVICVDKAETQRSLTTVNCDWRIPTDNSMPEGQVTPHPYYPRNLSLPGYRPNRVPLTELLGLFFGLVAIALISTWILAGRFNKRGADRVVICWFVVCGFIHSVLEGYFAANHETIIGGGSYLAEMWKEYGRGDSRYLTSDSFTVCMETITAVLDGPLCFAAAIAHLTGSRHRYPLQLIVSLCQLYGDTLYMCIEWKEDFVHGEYGHPLTFWFYFVFLNLFWIFVPLILIIQAYVALSASPSGDLHKTKKKK